MKKPKKVQAPPPKAGRYAASPVKIEENKRRKLKQHIRSFPTDHAAQRLFASKYGEPALTNTLSNLLAVARHKVRYLLRPKKVEAPVEKVL